MPQKPSTNSGVPVLPSSSKQAPQARPWLSDLDSWLTLWVCLAWLQNKHPNVYNLKLHFLFHSLCQSLSLLNSSTKYSQMCGAFSPHPPPSTSLPPSLILLWSVKINFSRLVLGQAPGSEVKDGRGSAMIQSCSEQLSWQFSGHRAHRGQACPS